MTNANDCGSCKGDCNKNTNELPLINSGFLILTERCPLACKYCFVKQNPNEMTYETAYDATQFLIKNAEASNETPSINFFGGEPMLKWDEIIVPLTRYIREEYKKPFKLSMTTNGVLVTQERLDFMKANEIGVLFSIDGAKTTQDINRPYHDGKSSFDSIEEVIDMMLAFDENSTFRATIHHESVEHTYENMRYAVDKGYNNMFFIPNVFHDWTEEQKQILKEQMRLFSDWYIEEARNGRIITLNPFDIKIGQINKINEAHKNSQYRSSLNIIGQGKCGLGATRFASIGTDGTLYGCQEMTSNDDVNSIFKIGNIYTGIDNDARIKLIQSFDKAIVKGTNCKTCLLDTVCDGGCVANNYMITGDINKMPDTLCYWEQLLLDEAIRVCRVLGAEKNILFKNKYFRKRNFNEQNRTAEFSK